MATPERASVHWRDVGVFDQLAWREFNALEQLGRRNVVHQPDGKWTVLTRRHPSVAKLSDRERRQRLASQEKALLESEPRSTFRRWRDTLREVNNRTDETLKMTRMTTHILRGVARSNRSLDKPRETVESVRAALNAPQRLTPYRRNKLANTLVKVRAPYANAQDLALRHFSGLLATASDQLRENNPVAAKTTLEWVLRPLNVRQDANSVPILHAAEQRSQRVTQFLTVEAQKRDTAIAALESLNRELIRAMSVRKVQLAKQGVADERVKRRGLVPDGMYVGMGRSLRGIARLLKRGATPQRGGSEEKVVELAPNVIAHLRKAYHALDHEPGNPTAIIPEGDHDLFTLHQQVEHAVYWLKKSPSDAHLALAWLERPTPPSKKRKR